MECRSCIEALTALMDDELEHPDRKKVEGHLELCSSCSLEFESLLFSYRLVDAVPEVDFDSNLWGEIHNRIPRRFTLPDLRFLFSRPWVPATATLLLALVVVSSFLITPSQSHLEKDFVTFIQERERISQENATLLFGDIDSDRYTPRRNPFVQPASLTNRNPFLE